MRQQTLGGCAFCDCVPNGETGEAHIWGQDEQITHPICIDCAIQKRPDPNQYDRHVCDGCGLVVDALAALTGFHVELGHLEGPLYLCAGCSPGGPATYWTQDLEEHVVAKLSE